MIRSSWNIAIIFLLLWTGLVTPYQLSFLEVSINQYDISTFMELIVDICFVLDIFINFITGYETKDGIIEYRLPKISSYYLRGFFFLDFLASFPFSNLIDES